MIQTAKNPLLLAQLSEADSGPESLVAASAACLHRNRPVHIRMYTAVVGERACLVERVAVGLPRGYITAAKRAGVTGNGMRYRVVISPGDRGARRDVQ